MIKKVSREQWSAIDRKQNYIHTEYYEKNCNTKITKKIIN